MNTFNIIRRDIALNSPSTSGNDLIEHALANIDSKYSIIGQFFVTTPFIKADTIKKSFDLLLANKDKTSCFGLYEVHDRFWHNNKPVNHDIKKLVGTQYMKPLMREAGFYVFKRSAFYKERSRVTESFVTFNVDSVECVDIDTKLDFLYAKSVCELLSES